MIHTHQVRIMQNGSAWYWEVLAQNRDVIARGVAETHRQARSDAEKAASRMQPACRRLPSHLSWHHGRVGH